MIVVAKSDKSDSNSYASGLRAELWKSRFKFWLALKNSLIDQSLSA